MSKKEVAVTAVTGTPAGMPLMVPVDSLKIGDNLRSFKESDESLKEFGMSLKDGIHEPLVVVPVRDHYVILAGSRRWRGAKLAGIKEVPVILSGVDPKDKAAMAKVTIAENLHRRNLSAPEEGMAYLKLRDLNGWEKDPGWAVKVAKVAKVSPAQVRTMTQLVEGLSSATLKALHEGLIARDTALTEIRPFIAGLPADIRPKVEEQLLQEAVEQQKKDDAKAAKVVTKGKKKGEKRTAANKHVSVTKNKTAGRGTVKKSAVQKAKVKLAAEDATVAAALEQEKAGKKKVKTMAELLPVIGALAEGEGKIGTFAKLFDAWYQSKVDDEALANGLIKLLS